MEDKLRSPALTLTHLNTHYIGLITPGVNVLKVSGDDFTKAQK